MRRAGPAPASPTERVDASVLYRQTGGVPLLLGAVLSGQPSPRARTEPVDVAGLVAARTQALRPNVREMLQVAALIGPEVDAELVANVTRGDSRTVRKALDRVVEGGGLLDEAKSQDGYMWRHPLVRQAVIDSLDGPSLRQFREAVGDAWEGQGEALRAARQALEVFDALEVTTRRLLATVVSGVEEALRTLAFEVAEELCRHGLGRCDRRSDPRLAVGLLNRLGSSLAYRARRDDAIEAWREAAGVARDAEDPALLAEVALATEPYARSTVDFPLRWELLNEVLPNLADLTPSAQVRVISAWVNEGSLNHHAQSRPALTDMAVNIARQSGDDTLLATALSAVHNAQRAARQVPTHISAELCTVADATEDLAWRGQAHLAALIDAVTMADDVRAEHHLAAYLQAADANPSPAPAGKRAWCAPPGRACKETRNPPTAMPRRRWTRGNAMASKTRRPLLPSTCSSGRSTTGPSTA